MRHVVAAALGMCAVVVIGSNSFAQGDCGAGPLNHYLPLSDRHIPFILADLEGLDGTTTIADFEAAAFNDTDPLRNIGDYFEWLSYGEVTVTGDFIVQPGGGEEWYHSSLHSDSVDALGDRAAFIDEILTQAIPNLDLSQYAIGTEVPAIAIVHAGFGVGAEQVFISSHYPYLPTWPQPSGYTVNAVILVSEKWLTDRTLEGETGEVLPFSVWCHEICHNYGLPDVLCSVGPSSASTVGIWDVMSKGALGGGFYQDNADTHWDTANPVNMNPWFKYQLGWIDDTELVDVKTTSTLDIGHYEESQTQYAKAGILRLKGEDEFFMFANWNATDYQTTLPDEGMLIYHFDLTASQGPPFGFAIEQADGLHEFECQPGLDRSTVPANDLWDSGMAFVSGHVPGASLRKLQSREHGLARWPVFERASIDLRALLCPRKTCDRVRSLDGAGNREGSAGQGAFAPRTACRSVRRYLGRRRYWRSALRPAKSRDRRTRAPAPGRPGSSLPSWRLPA